MAQEDYLATAEALATALHELRQLEHLTLAYLEWLPEPPVALENMTALKSFCWVPADTPGGGGGSLPAGPWLAGLRQLAAPTAMLGNSLDKLAAARQLERLYMQSADAHLEAAGAVMKESAEHCPHLFDVVPHVEAPIPAHVFPKLPPRVIVSCMENIEWGKLCQIMGLIAHHHLRHGW